MPTYHYVCPKCDHDFEVFTQRISDSPKTKKCPACGGRARRQISGGAGFLFKGEGFYVTDYRSEEYRSKAKKETEGSSEEKSEKKSDKKTKETDRTPPETKSDTAKKKPGESSGS